MHQLRDMTAQERAIYDMLLAHNIGEERAQPREKILERWNHFHGIQHGKLTDRAFRQIVADLVTHFSRPICTTSAGGYFIARTGDELDMAVRDLESKGTTILERARALRKAQPLEPQKSFF
jgi:hypothetical protein